METLSPDINASEQPWLAIRVENERQNATVHVRLAICASPWDLNAHILGQPECLAGQPTTLSVLQITDP